MKKFKYPILAGLFTILAFCVFFIRCSKSPVNGINLRVNTPYDYQSPRLVNFINGNTSSKTTMPTTFTVTIVGQNADAVVNNDGKTTFSVQHGVLALALKKSVFPTPSNPVNFIIKASVPGFLPVMQNVSITDTTAKGIKVTLIETANPMKGVSVSNGSFSLTGGSAASAISINTTTNSGLSQVATLTIPKGTTFTDANGHTVSGSSLTSNIVMYDATVGDAIPGSLHVNNAVRADGTPITTAVDFISAGMLSINMSVGSTPVKHFSQPVPVSIELSSKVSNPATGLPYAVGDTIPVWSQDESTGNWTYENTTKAAVVTKNAAGNLAANFSITHLSGWNLDWSWTVFAGSCSNPLKVNIHGITGNYDVTLIDANGNYLGADHQECLHDGMVVTFPYTPNVSQARVAISNYELYPNVNYSYGGAKILCQTDLFNPCSKGSVDIGPIPAANLPQSVNVTVGLQGKCTDKNVLVNVGGLWYYVFDNNYNLIAYNFLNSGSTTTLGNVPVNVPLYVYVYYNGQYYYSTVTLQKQNYSTFGVSTGQNAINASATYDAVSNTLNVSSVVFVSCK